MRVPHPGERLPIGVDVGGRAISAVQVSPRGDGWRIEAAAVLDRPAGSDRGIPSATEAERLADVLYRQGFSGRRIVLGAPDAALLTAVLELPPRSAGAPVEQLAKMELSRVHKRDPASFEMACWDIPAPARAGEASHIMAAACGHDAANALLDVFEGAGFAVGAIDARAWAMARACRPRTSDDRNVSALLDLGEDGALLSVIRGGVVVYDRLMADSGLGALRSRLGAELGIEPEVADYVLSIMGTGGDRSELPPGADAMVEEHVETLTAEMRSAMDYAIHRYPGDADRLLVMGPGAGLAELPGKLTAGLGVAAAAVSPADVAECPDVLLEVCRNPGLMVAFGLATWSVRGAA